MKENGKYRILQGCYWIMCGVCFSYLTFFLSGYGYSASKIGVLSALIGAISALSQPVLGRLADRNKKFGWKKQLLYLLTICSAALILLIFCGNRILVGVLLVVLLVCVNCTLPLLNSISSYYENKGIHIDYGVARSCGSAAYAAVTLFIGYLTNTFGVKTIPVSMFLVPIAMLFVLRTMPYEEEELSAEQTVENQTVSRKKENFIKKYPAFCTILVASVLTFAVHNLTCIFLLQMMERVGGNSSHLGTALFIAGVMEIPAMFLFTRMVKVISPSSLLIISGVTYAVKMVLFLLAGSVGMVYVIHILQFCSYGIYAPSTVRFAEDCMQEEDRVTGQAMMTMTMTASSIIGSLLGGWLIDQYGVTMMLLVGTVIGFVAVVFWVSGVVMYRKSLRIVK